MLFFLSGPMDARGLCEPGPGNRASKPHSDTHSERGKNFKHSVNYHLRTPQKRYMYDKITRWSKLPTGNQRIKLYEHIMNDIKRKRGRPTKNPNGVKRVRFSCRLSDEAWDWLRREQRLRLTRDGVRISLGEALDELVRQYQQIPPEIDL